MLFEQGCEQAHIWTRRPAPRHAIAAGLAAFVQRMPEFATLPRTIQEELPPA